MKLIFVRHGHPDYRNDCLTPLGAVQAETVAERLLKTPADAVYSSSFGRAKDTAAPFLQKTGLPVTILDWMHEVTWAPKDGDGDIHMKYHPWLRAEELVKAGIDPMTVDKNTLEFYTNSTLSDCYERIRTESDLWLKELGYERQGHGYVCRKENTDTVLLFAHHGSGTCLMSHLTNIPLFYLFANFNYAYTGISEFDFEGKEGEFLMPKLSLFNEHVHIGDCEMMLSM